MSQLINFAYLVAAILFILGLKGLSSPKSALRGNQLGAIGMLIAIIATLLDHQIVSYWAILISILIGSTIGVYVAKKVEMTSMPQMVALFNGLGGGSSLFVAGAAYLEATQLIVNTGEDQSLAWAVALLLSTIIGAITLSGSIIALMKLEGYFEDAFQIPSHQNVLKAFAGVIGILFLILCLSPFLSDSLFILLVILALVLGVLLVIGIGGADMPVVIALLNSYSGLAAASTGFVLQNNGLIISGSLVGASGIILTNIMCKAMNRSLPNVLFGGAIAGQEKSTPLSGQEFYDGKIKNSSAEEVAMLLEDAQSVIFVPGYGLAVAQAQHVTRELADMLMTKGTKVLYAIHPVAGRMPGHMNVLLAEAEVPYEQLIEMDAINPEFSHTDVVIILGANDVTNPAARDDQSSPIFGMPILEVDKARTVVVVKRSLSPGFAGIPNELFIKENTLMVFGDAKSVLQGMINAVKEW